MGLGHPTSGAGSVGCASVCVWGLLPPSRAHLWQKAWMTSCSGTLLAFDLEFPAMDNVFSNTRARLHSCRGGRCGCLLLVPVFPSWLLPTAPGFPLFRVPPGRALTAQGCSERNKAKHKKTSPPNPFVSRRLRAQLHGGVSCHINRLLSVAFFFFFFKSYSELFWVL